MARPFKPARVLELSGAFRKNPARKKARESQLGIKPGVGDPPKEWVEKAAISSRSAALLGIWEQVVAQDVLRVLNISHRLLVENTCYLMYKIRLASMGTGKATSGDFAQVTANLTAMGQTPISSPRVAGAVRVPEREGSQSRPGSGWGEYVG